MTIKHIAVIGAGALAEEDVRRPADTRTEGQGHAQRVEVVIGGRVRQQQPEAERGQGWRRVEAPLDLAGAVRALSALA